VESEKIVETDEGYLVNTEEAARLLGVKPSTVYTYVSRGALTPKKLPGDRTSWFLKEEVESRLQITTRRRSGPTVTRPAIETKITLIEDGYYWYRGSDPAVLARTASFESVAEYLWSGSREVGEGWDDRISLSGLPSIPFHAPPLDRIRLALAGTAVFDPLRLSTEADSVRLAARRILVALVRSLPLVGPVEPETEASLAEELWPRLSPLEPLPERIRALDAVLIIMADHGLAPSTRAARLAASFHADPYGVVAAGIGVLAGGWHGGRSLSAEPMIREIEETGDVAGAVGEVLILHGKIPCLDHPRYPNGDPRDGILVDIMRGVEPGHRLLEQYEELAELIRRRALPAPSVELTLAMVGRLFDMIDGSSLAMFAIGRTAGWIGHALEAYSDERRGPPAFTYVGERPIL